MSRRAQDWPKRLDEFVATRGAQPFAWGSNDCCIFVCDWALACTGEDMATPGFRSQYDTALGAARALSSYGGLRAGVERVADERTKAHGFAELLSVLMAQRGDMVSHDTGRGIALGVCIGSQCLFAGGERVPLAKCRRAWRIS